MNACPEYSLGEVLYSIFRLNKKTTEFAKTVRELSGEDMYKLVQKAVEEEVETEPFKNK